MRLFLCCAYGMSIVERVAARVTADLGIGKTFFSGNLRIHRFRDSITVTDLTNAGKRGKRVKEMYLTPSYGFATEAERMNVLDELSAALVKTDTYTEALAAVRTMTVAYPNKIELRESDLRGVDVEPMGTKFSLTTKTGLLVEASPNDFRVLNRWPLTDPKTGEPNGQFMDTNYHPYKKQDAILFYGWLKDNVSKVNSMTMAELRRQWDALGVKYDSH